MGDRSAIEWTDASWNPVRGCTRVSAGCGGPGKHGGCYAEKIAARFSDPGQPFHGFAERRNGEARWTGNVDLVEDKLALPLTWRKPRRIFVNSMSDLFHEALPDSEIDRVFAVMALAPQHTFQVLTKRPERMREYFASRTGELHLRIWARANPYGSLPVTQQEIETRLLPGLSPECRKLFHASEPVFPLPNVWLGASCEDQPTADERIPHLLQTPAAARFVSAEPLLGPIDLTNLDCGGGLRWDALGGRGRKGGIDWVITGGESGPRARPAHPDWFRSLQKQCEASGVAYFHKQNGEFSVLPTDRERGKEHIFLTKDWDFVRVGKKAAGRLLDGREHSEFPQVKR